MTPVILLVVLCIPLISLSCGTTGDNGKHNRSSVWTHPDLADRNRVRVPLNHSAALVWLPADQSGPSLPVSPEQKQTLINDLKHLSLFQNWNVLDSSNSLKDALKKAQKANIRMLLVLQPREGKSGEQSESRLSVQVRLFDLQLDETHPIWERVHTGFEAKKTASDRTLSLKEIWWNIRAKIAASLLDWHKRVVRN